MRCKRSRTMPVRMGWLKMAVGQPPTNTSLSRSCPRAGAIARSRTRFGSTTVRAHTALCGDQLVGGLRGGGDQPLQPVGGHAPLTRAAGAERVEQREQLAERCVSHRCTRNARVQRQQAFTPHGAVRVGPDQRLVPRREHARKGRRGVARGHRGPTDRRSGAKAYLAPCTANSATLRRSTTAALSRLLRVGADLRDAAVEYASDKPNPGLRAANTAAEAGATLASPRLASDSSLAAWDS